MRKIQLQCKQKIFSCNRSVTEKNLVENIKDSSATVVQLKKPSYIYTNTEKYSFTTMTWLKNLNVQPEKIVAAQHK
jgi:hypothetical protein